MKAKFIVIFPVLCLFLISFKPLQRDTATLYNNTQDLKIVGIYDGNEGYGYNFITKHQIDGTDLTMTFQNVDETVMKEFDLDADLFLNQNFEVTYTMKTEVSKDENGMEVEDEIYTITGLKEL